jgi:hypothetical protein
MMVVSKIFDKDQLFPVFFPTLVSRVVPAVIMSEQTAFSLVGKYLTGIRCPRGLWGNLFGGKKGFHETIEKKNSPNNHGDYETGGRQFYHFLFLVNQQLWVYYTP